MCCLLGTFSEEKLSKNTQTTTEPLPLFSQVIGFPFRSTRRLNRILMESIKILALIITTDNPRVLTIRWYLSIWYTRKTNWKTNASIRLDAAWLVYTYTGTINSLNWLYVMIYKNSITKAHIWMFRLLKESTNIIV